LRQLLVEVTDASRCPSVVDGGVRTVARRHEDAGRDERPAADDREASDCALGGQLRRSRLRRRGEEADIPSMRLLATSLAALALSPPFGIWDLQRDLAPTSRNGYGDVQPKPRAALRGKTFVRCGTWCRFGAGWLAFRTAPALGRGDVASATSGYSKRLGWHVRLELTSSGRRRWEAFVRRVRLRGLPDVLVVAAGGEVAAAPLATEVSGLHGTVTLTDFTKASARAVVTALR
jgi:hypothetical protein